VRGQIRAVTHLGVSAEDVELAIRAAADILQSNRRGMGSSVGSRTRTGY
jgi:hypothetical protein